MQTKTIVYKFEFDSAAPVEIVLDLEASSLDLIKAADSNQNKWTALDFHQCQNCPLVVSECRECPVALGLVPILDAVAGKDPSAETNVTVITQERTYSRSGRLDAGLSSLTGLVMVTSGCPILDKLRPMAHTHLPFASTAETTYRSVSMYLMAQYFVRRNGGEPDWDLKNLVSIYASVNKVNNGFTRRIRNIRNQSVSAGAVNHLDWFASSIALAIAADWWADFEDTFAAYI